MRQLHVQLIQLWPSLQTSMHCFESIDSESVTIAVGLFRGVAETQFSQLLNLT
jgi:hypothetical protein